MGEFKEGTYVKDWIDDMNDYAQQHNLDDRWLVEVFIMFIHDKKLGGEFMKKLRLEVP